MKTSTGVDARRRRWETNGFKHSGSKDEPFRQSHDGGAGEKFDLILPASKKEEGGFSPSGYDASVAKGSNEIVFEEKIVRAGPVERAFRWEWKRYQPSSARGAPVVLFNSHKAEVKIAITPRY